MAKEQQEKANRKAAWCAWLSCIRVPAAAGCLSAGLRMAYLAEGKGGGTVGLLGLLGLLLAAAGLILAVSGRKTEGKTRRAFIVGTVLNALILAGAAALFAAGLQAG